MILPEIGGQVTRLDHREENIQTLEKGIRNVMRYLKILDEPVEKREGYLHLQIEFLYSRHGGIHKPLKRGGERVKQGDTLAVITDVFGQEIDRVSAPYDCVIEGYWAYSVVLPCGWSYVIGREVDA